MVNQTLGVVKKLRNTDKQVLSPMREDVEATKSAVSSVCFQKGERRKWLTFLLGQRVRKNEQVRMKRREDKLGGGAQTGAETEKVDESPQISLRGV